MRRMSDRRRFLMTLGALPLAGAVLPSLAQSPPPPTPAPPPPAPASTDPEVAADAQSLLEIVKRRYGARLDAAQLDSVREDLEGILGSGRTLRKLELQNADEPDIVFRAREE